LRNLAISISIYKNFFKKLLSKGNSHTSSIGTNLLNINKNR